MSEAVAWRCSVKKKNIIFTGKHLCRSFFFNKVNSDYFHVLVLESIPSEAAVYK